MITLPFSSVHERRLPGPNGELVTVREGRIKWERSENPVQLGSQTYDVKPQVEVEGRRLVPELALLRFAEREGWQGAWMDNFHWKCWRAMPNRNEPWVVRERFAAFLGEIVEPEVSMGRMRWPGCWDLFVWRGEAVAFIESKGGEGLEDSQLRFFASALGAGIPPTAFTLVEWELRPAAKHATARGSNPTCSRDGRAKQDAVASPSPTPRGSRQHLPSAVASRGCRARRQSQSGSGIHDHEPADDQRAAPLAGEEGTRCCGQRGDDAERWDGRKVTTNRAWRRDRRCDRAAPSVRVSPYGRPAGRRSRLTPAHTACSYRMARR